MYWRCMSVKRLEKHLNKNHRLYSYSGPRPQTLNSNRIKNKVLAIYWIFITTLF